MHTKDIAVLHDYLGGFALARFADLDSHLAAEICQDQSIRLLHCEFLYDPSAPVDP
jgi:hypothetical protein